MHTIEPFYAWRNDYITSDDKLSPFFGRKYSEFTFSNRVYNYYIHPQWDEFGSNTLYAKILFADYEEQFAILEFIGEWNDAVYNDIMYLKRNVVDVLVQNGIFKFILICENVLHFHADDNCYYEEWWDDIKDQDGWVAFLNIRKHIEEEMHEAQMQYYCNFGNRLNDLNWRKYKPQAVLLAVENLLFSDNSRTAID